MDFVYSDTDIHPNEIAELYSYTEQNEFLLNVKVRLFWPLFVLLIFQKIFFCLQFQQAFEEQMVYYKLVPGLWQKLTEKQRKDFVLRLLDQLDLSKKSLRMKAARSVLYLAQGCFSEVQSDHEQQLWTRTNVKLLYEMGLFPVFVELLNYEIEYVILGHLIFFLTSSAKHKNLFVEIPVQQILQCEKWLFH